MSVTKGSLATHRPVLRRVMNRPLTALVAALSLAVGLVVFPTWPMANATEAYADEIMDQVRASTPSEAPGAAETPLTLVAETGGYAGASSTLSVAVPQASGASLVVDSEAGLPLMVGLPDLNVSDAVLNSESDAVVFPDNGDDVAVAVQAFDEGVQLSTVLNGVDAPEAFSYAVSVPVGGTVTLLEEGGVAITDAEGFAVGFMSQPWAQDGAGQSVSTRYSVSGSVVTQHVDHQGQNVQYPIVADPFLWKDLISSASWTWTPRSPGGAIGAGWTLQVKPTKWARINGTSYIVGYLGWRELYNRFKDKGLCCNLNSMMDQWICHQQFVSIRDPFASTWNLDEWRQDVSYLKTVRYQCNPPRGGSYVWN